VRLNFSTLYKAGRSANSELSSKTGNKKQKERGRACVIPKIAQVIQETGGRGERRRKEEKGGERRRKGGERRRKKEKGGEKEERGGEMRRKEEEEREKCGKPAAKEKRSENERIEEQDKAANKYELLT